MSGPEGPPVRHVLISGASGGLGRALAAGSAKQGTFLSLWGRDSGRLSETGNACEKAGASVGLTVQDVRDHDACRRKLRALFSLFPVDMAILNAGVSSGIPPGGSLEPAEDACRTMEVDCCAAINMAAALLEGMRERGSGHLVFISSIAALYPLPCSPAYSAAKAGLACYAKALSLGLRGTGVRVSLVYPGYIASPMSRRLAGPQPFRISAEEAARRILDGLASGRDRIVFPKLLALGTSILHFLPDPLAAFFLKGFSFTVEPDSESPLASLSSGSGDRDSA